MSGVSVQYKDSTIASVSDTGTKVLKTSGKYCESDITIQYDKPTASELVSGTKSITTNGTHDVTSYKNASVNVPIPDGYVKPSGSVTITANGTHDVSSKASAVVNVPSTATANTFTNIFDLATTEKRVGYIAKNTGLSTQAQTIAVICEVPKGTVKVRVRSVVPFSLNSQYSMLCNSPDDTSMAYGKQMMTGGTYDEHGDVMATINNSAGYKYLIVNFQKAWTAHESPGWGIMTFNEPIGNGGYIE